jgi:hypothetical protein
MIHIRGLSSGRCTLSIRPSPSMFFFATVDFNARLRGEMIVFMLIPLP